MLNRFILVCFLFTIQFGVSQNGFQFENNRNKTSIPFKFINNLIIITINVNGTPLNFLLDTGVEDSVLFSVDDTEGVSFSNIEKIRIKGFGSNEAFDAYKSAKNTLSIKNYTDHDHTLYLVLDQNINISSQIGVPVNGIIGYQFFKNYLVKIDYTAKRITLYNDKPNSLKKNTKSFAKFPLEFIDNKPYLSCNAFFEKDSVPLKSKLLIDTGNSDAVWFFSRNDIKIVVPKVNFEDFLGRGFSGDVFGIRGRISSVTIGDFEFKNPLAAFPNSDATTTIDKIDGRVGSVGSEIMRRFTVIFDYKSNMIYLQKNNQFEEPFNFNMSGLEVQHQGLQWIKADYEENPAISNNLFDADGNKIANNLKYKFELKPIYVIANVRKNSPAAIAGFQKEDVIVKINKKDAFTFTLEQINDLLKSEEGKVITFVVDRKGKLLTFSIILKNIL